MPYILLRLRAALAAWDVILLSITFIVVYYEGVRPVRDLRYIGTVITYVPLIGDIVEGEIARRIDDATAGLVTEAELAAARAALDEERRLALAAAQATTEAAKRADAARRVKEAGLAALDQRIRDDRDPEKRAVLTEEDIQWLDAR